MLRNSGLRNINTEFSNVGNICRKNNICRQNNIFKHNKSKYYRLKEKHFEVDYKTEKNRKVELLTKLKNKNKLHEKDMRLKQTKIANWKSPSQEEIYKYFYSSTYLTEERIPKKKFTKYNCTY